MRATAALLLTLSLGCAPPPGALGGPAPRRQPSATFVAPVDTPALLPLIGGTLAISADGAVVAVADPEGDRVLLVELATMTVKAHVSLEPGDQPGRVIEDGAGRFHVALRGGGALATLDREGTVLLRREACPAPRGLALDPDGDRLHLACAGGELLTFGVLDPAPSRVLRPAPDLRDVVATHDRLHVTRYRSAEVLTLDADGNLEARRRPPPFDLDGFLGAEVVGRPRRIFTPTVAARLLKDPASGELVLLHQRAARFPVDLEVGAEPTPTGYGGPRPGPLFSCPPGISHATLTRLEPIPNLAPGFGSELERFPLPGAVASSILAHGVPIDLAVSPDGARVALLYPGAPFDPVEVVDRGSLDGRGCAGVGSAPGFGEASMSFEEPVAAVWIDATRLAVQYRRPGALVVYGGRFLGEVRAVALGPRRARHRGHELFHGETSLRIACAGCHPEGGDDGHVWDLGRFGGVRRTQPLFADVTGTAPFHWSGDLPSLRALVDDVYGRRMGGPALDDAELTSLEELLAQIPAAPRASARDDEAVERGRARFLDAGCARCHGGPRLSDGRAHDVGTGARLETPTLLGLAARGPYLHDGRAPTLGDRLAAGHTEGHGDLAGMDARDLEDLVAYLETL